MERKIMEQKVIELFEDIFNIPTQTSPDNFNQGELADWDSIGHIRLITALEKEFNVRIPIEVAIDLSSLGRIVDYLAENIG